jgi:uncharacterized RDD family membrane protein YckC
VDLTDRVTIATPEGVELELALAGLGSRFVAALLDSLIQVGLWLALLITFGILEAADVASAIGVAFVSVGAFLIVFGYDVAFETLNNGRTPGKRMAGVRVVRTGGQPIGLRTSAVRNLVRMADILPGMYGVGMVSIMATRRNQRLGDLAAGTLVVRESTRPAGPPTQSLYRPSLGELAQGWDLGAVTADDLAAIRRFIERRALLEAAPRARIAAELAAAVRPKVAGAAADLPDEHFLEAVAAAKASRG